MKSKYFMPLTDSFVIKSESSVLYGMSDMNSNPEDQFKAPRVERSL